MQILVALEIADTELATAYGNELTSPYFDDDLVASLDARLDEFYAGRNEYPVRARVVAVGDFTTVLPLALDAMEVGVEGIGDDRAGHITGSILTMRQMLDGYEA